MNTPNLDNALILPDYHAWEGINTLLNAYIRMVGDEDFVIAYTPDSREAAAWVAVALQQRGAIPRLLSMLPLSDVGFQERFRSSLPKPDQIVSRLVILIFERYTVSHNTDIHSVLSEYDTNQYQVLRAINSGIDLFSNALKYSPTILSARNTAILERCLSANRLVVKTRSGTQLEIGLDNKRYRWVSNTGLARPGKPLVIPSGEVATFPASISGTLVADFAVHINIITDIDTRLTNYPVTVEIEKGRLVNFECTNKELRKFLSLCFSRENAHNVGELGFGTNPGVVSPVRDNSHINERRPGVHIGFGQHNQPKVLVGYSCDIHIDLIAQGGSIWVDNDTIPIDLEELEPSPNPHPLHYSEVDIFSTDEEHVFDGDCCGVLASG
jgi:hypothetical protein